MIDRPTRPTPGEINERAIIRPNVQLRLVANCISSNRRPTALCLISAHGGCYKGTGTFEVPDGTEVIFDDDQQGRFNTMIKLTNDKAIDALMRDILRHRATSVVTIRNRWFLPGGDVYMKEVIREVRKAFPGIQRFHCSFCRGLVSDENAQTSVVKIH